MKIVVAYSGGLDTSVILHWLKETYQCEVVAFCADIGQEEELHGLDAKARATGAAEFHALDLVESYREMASSLLDIYLSSLSNRLNDVMKVLTIIATVFIPLSFIVGLYGMNFDRSVSPWNMPELGMRFGYPLLWLVMLSVVAGMLYYFRRKRWF